MRAWGTLVSAGVLGLVLWPGTWARGRDSFPLSSYPMFARHEVDPTIRLDYAVGVSADGSTRVIPPEVVASHEVLQTRAALARAVAAGAAATQRLCETVAARVAGEEELGDVREVRIVTGVHDAVAFLRGERDAGERVRARCRVER